MTDGPPRSVHNVSFRMLLAVALGVALAVVLLCTVVQNVAFVQNHATQQNNFAKQSDDAMYSSIGLKEEVARLTNKLARVNRKLASLRRRACPMRSPTRRFIFSDKNTAWTRKNTWPCSDCSFTQMHFPTKVQVIVDIECQRERHFRLTFAFLGSGANCSTHGTRLRSKESQRRRQSYALGPAPYNSAGKNRSSFLEKPMFGA